MSRFIESICYKDGEYHLLAMHQQRLEKAFAAHFPNAKPHNLKSVLPDLELPEKYKVRVVYDAESIDLEYSMYHPRTVDTIQSIEKEDIVYSHKYEDRSELHGLYNLRGEADDILIIKNGLITDSYFANVVLWDGKNWYTPSSYLLNGVKRQYLIENGLVIETRIRKNDLFAFEKISLVNAMLDPGEIEIPIEKVLIS